MKQSTLRKEYWTVQHLPVLNSVWKFHIRAISLFNRSFLWVALLFTGAGRSVCQAIFCHLSPVLINRESPRWLETRQRDPSTRRRIQGTTGLSDWFWFYGRSRSKSSWVPSNCVCGRARGLGLASKGSWKAGPAWSPWSGWPAYWMTERLEV